MKDIEEADSWLDAARFTLGNTRRGRERFTVSVAQSIHALIKANDALTMRFLKRRSTRHEDASVLFGELVKHSKIDARYASLRALLVKASAEKSKYDYRGIDVGQNEAERWLGHVEEFVDCARGILNE